VRRNLLRYGELVGERCRRRDERRAVAPWWAARSSRRNSRKRRVRQRAEKQPIGERPAQRRAVSLAVPAPRTYGKPPGGTMRRRTDISSSSNASSRLNAMGLLLSSGHNLELNGVTRRCFDQDTPARPRPPTPDEAAIDAHFNRFAGPDHQRRIHPGRRTICGSPARRDLTRNPRRREAPPRIVVSSRTGEFKADHRPITREIEWEGKCAISTGRCNLLCIGPSRGKASSARTRRRDRYPHVPDGASGIGVDHTAAEFDRDHRRSMEFPRSDPFTQLTG
jgi:hypothetical protein